MELFEIELYRNALERVAGQLPVRDAKVLITGATGLIGSCMTDVLLYSNENLNCDFDIYVMGRSQRKMEQRFSYAKDWKTLHFIEQDVCQEISMKVDVDYIIHAASNADPISYALYPAETLLTNVYGTKNVLDHARECKKTTVLLLSTFEVYGNIGDAQQYCEDHVGILDFNVLRSGYPESKRCAELLLKSYEKEYGVRGIIGRLASIYGPTMLENDSKAHAQFIRNGISGKNIVLKSEGRPNRTYCYVMDAVSALFKIMFEGSSGESYNIANENSIASIAEVAKCVAQLCKTEVVFDLPNEIEKRGYSKPQNCVLNNEKLRKLGWKGDYTLYEGMEQTISILQMMKQ